MGSETACEQTLFCSKIRITNAKIASVIGERRSREPLEHRARYFRARSTDFGAKESLLAVYQRWACSQARSEKKTSQSTFRSRGWNKCENAGNETALFFCVRVNHPSITCEIMPRKNAQYIPIY